MFADETAVQLIPNVCRTWTAVGCTPVLRHAARRDKISLLGGISWSPATGACDILLHMRPQQNIDSEAIIPFLDGLHQMFSGPVTLVWDNIKTHHSRLVQQYVNDHADWLELVFLPPYCPELNPIEYVWSAWKRTYLGNYCPKHTDELCDFLLENEQAMSDQELIQGCIAASKLITTDELAPRF